MKRKLKKLFLSIFYRKLWVRIGIVLLLVVTAPIVALGTLLINTSQNAVSNSVLNDYKQIVIRAASEIDLYIRNPQDILAATVAVISEVYPSPWKEETILVELALQQPSIMYASTIDLSGSELACSSLGSGTPRYYGPELLSAVSDGRMFVSGIKIFEERVPYMTIAVPIKKMGQPVGALVADVNVRGIWEIIDGITVGYTGRVFMVSRDGTLLAHPDKKRVLRGENFRGRSEVRSVLAGNAGAVESLDREDGEVLSAYAPVRHTGWGVVLTQSRDEAYRFARVMRLQAWAIIVVSELIAVLASVLLGRFFARPIKVLASRMKRVAAGNLDVQIAFSRRDDMGELVRAFNEMTRKLRLARKRERLSAIGEAVASITHELKNSAVSIRAFFKMFVKRHNDEKFIAHFSKLLPEELNRLDRMFQELSDFSSNFALQPARVDVAEVANGVIDVMRDEFSSIGIDIAVHSPEGGVMIDADAGRLKQVFLNLLINAEHAMHRGGKLTVSISEGCSSCAGDPACVTVSFGDTGKGMSREVLERLFEPFHMTTSGGMGLGLTISRKIVELHGGSISVESRLNKGTVFIVRLPRKQGLHPGCAAMAPGGRA